MTKIIAFYLPQFHSIPENDAVWGKGFTEWDNVKSGHPFFKGHDQPRVPYHQNYYNLLDEQTILWQTQLAQKYDVYGFCIYHYWFSGKKLLNKPLELIRDSTKINFPYCISWANESWTDAWDAKDKPRTFLEQKYGDRKEWIEHFNYLATFFQDPNYIKEDNRPLLVIYRPENIPVLEEMLSLWNKMAQELGFAGLKYAYQQSEFRRSHHAGKELFDYSIEYQPKYAIEDLKQSGAHDAAQGLKKVLKKMGLLDLASDIKHGLSKKKLPYIYDYNQLANLIIQRHAEDSTSIAGMFVGYDNTPRKAERGEVIQSTPAEFQKYLRLQLQNVHENYDNDLLFMFAWNEWAESGYLEPDEHYHYQYLEIIKTELARYQDSTKGR